MSKDQINEHYQGFLLQLAKSSIELANNIFSCFRTKIEDDPEIALENKLLARANQYEIRCPECFAYKGWIIRNNKSNNKSNNK